MPRKAATKTTSKTPAKRPAATTRERLSPIESLSASQIAREAHRRHMLASYDAAQTTTGNTKHWTYADDLSADAAHTSAVRKTLRRRARYESANNSYAKGIVVTLANDTIGTGPRLQMLTLDKANNARIEADFAEWAAEIKLAEKLRTCRQAKAVDGEAFLLPVNSSRLSTAVKLNLRVIETEMVATPTLWGESDTQIDGIVLDDNGDPLEYHVLKYHPGGLTTSFTLEYAKVPADRILHWFRADRGHQHRGISELTPALPLFAQLRRYTLATLSAAELAALFPLTIETANPPDDGSLAPTPMDTVELERGQATVLPDGYRLGQVKPEQPTTTYPDFKREIISEIARCLSVPLNVALCDSSDYNYASGRLDYQVYFKSIAVERDQIEAVILEKVFRWWLQEYAAERSGIRPSDIEITLRDYPHQWYWDGREHVDPQKEANALDVRLKNGTASIPAEFAKAGQDWEEQMTLQAQALGMTLAEYQERLRDALFPVKQQAQPAQQAAA